MFTEWSLNIQSHLHLMQRLGKVSLFSLDYEQVLFIVEYSFVTIMLQIQKIYNLKFLLSLGKWDIVYYYYFFFKLRVRQTDIAQRNIFFTFNNFTWNFYLPMRVQIFSKYYILFLWYEIYLQCEILKYVNHLKKN